jgi:hypothetical protein
VRADIPAAMTVEHGHLARLNDPIVVRREQDTADGRLAVEGRKMIVSGIGGRVLRAQFHADRLAQNRVADSHRLLVAIAAESDFSQDKVPLAADRSHNSSCPLPERTRGYCVR